MPRRDARPSDEVTGSHLACSGRGLMSKTNVSASDEPIDAYVTRPLAARLVRVVVHTTMTPNQLTATSAALGSGAGFAFSRGTPLAAFVGALLLFAAMVFDCSDGQLARARGGGSMAGRIIDGLADYWVAFAVHLGILLHLGERGVVVLGHTLDARARFFFVLAAGVSMAVHAGRFDRTKQRYLADTRGRVVERADDYFREARAASSWADRGVLYLFGAYVKLQEGRARPEREPFTPRPWSAVEVRRLRLQSLIGPSMHFASMCLAGALAPTIPSALEYYCIFSIFAINAYSATLRVLEGRVARLVPNRAS
jgi:phosphatidylglycerophosphate synthase